MAHLCKDCPYVLGRGAPDGDVEARPPPRPIPATNGNPNLCKTFYAYPILLNERQCSCHLLEKWGSPGILPRNPAPPSHGTHNILTPSDCWLPEPTEIHLRVPKLGSDARGVRRTSRRWDAPFMEKRGTTRQQYLCCHPPAVDFNRAGIVGVDDDKAEREEA